MMYNDAASGLTEAEQRLADQRAQRKLHPLESCEEMAVKSTYRPILPLAVILESRQLELSVA